METIEYRTVDKAEWGVGPWNDEPDKRQWTDEETGLPCLIVRGWRGALCGYVGVGPTHPAYGKDYSDVDVDVHWGLTFASKCSHGPEDKAICHKVGPGESDDVWWLGFDCAHFGDLCPGINRLIPSAVLFGRGEYRTIDWVAAETASLARQLFDKTE